MSLVTDIADAVAAELGVAPPGTFSEAFTAEEVRNGFDGQTLLAAQKAFYEELIGFFQSRGRRDRAKAVAKQVEMINAAVTAVETRIDAIDVEQTIRGAMSGESPEALASTPDP